MKKLNTLGPGLIIGIPTLGRPVPLDWALAFKGMNPPINYNVNFNIIYGHQVADARNSIAKAAVVAKAKYLFFLGDDVVCPAHTLRQLIFRMEQDENIGVVGGVYSSKCDPSAPLVFKGNGVGSYWDWKVGEFFECTGLGMDCTLIRVSMLEKLTEPWFKTVDEDQFLDGVNKAEMWTEDLFFCNKVLEETDYNIYCDGSVICDHWDIYANKPYRMPHDSLPMRIKSVNKPLKALVMGSYLENIPNDYAITICNNDEVYDRADYRCTYNNLPFADNEFDLIVRGLNCDQDILNGFYIEWRRVLKQGGKLIIELSPLFNPANVIEDMNKNSMGFNTTLIRNNIIELSK